MATHAAMSLGAAFVPMYESQLPKDWAYILQDCEPSLVVVSTPAIRDKLTSPEHVQLPASVNNILTFDSTSSDPSESWNAAIAAFVAFSFSPSSHSAQPETADI